MLDVKHALNLPVPTRCAELTVLLDRASLLELHNFFPILIDNIFGPQGTVCWDLRTTTEGKCEDFNQLHHFLSPCGPLFKVVYTLLKDPNIKYDFPLLYLPVRIKHILEYSVGHPFYSELVNINSQTKQVTSLLLNPFDYYFFHFAYHLINPWQQRVGSCVKSWNTVYYVLCCDYILHFLPTDPSVGILPEIYYNGKNPNKQISPQSSSQPSPRGITSSGLVSPLTFNKSVDKNSLVNLDRHHPRNDIWRSETVLTVLTDMWLHNDSVSQSITTNDINDSLNKTRPMMLHYNELPTGEYMRIVRVLIKQLHAFSDSAKCDDTNLSELKKIAIPMIQVKFYVFIRNLIHKWPLDGSFRLVLELWLTYIQPWRYPASNLIKKVNQKNMNPDADDIGMGPDKQQLQPTREHLHFIAENLLCYVVIFEQLLPRFGRVDLVSPKMSLMLYRITKVFDQPNLPDFLREIEQCVENRQHSPTHQQYSGWSNNLSSLLPNNNWSTNLPISNNGNSEVHAQSANVPFLSNATGQADKKWMAIIRQKIFELEGPNFCYKPLFSNPPAHEIYELIVQIKKAVKYSQELIRMKEQQQKELYSGIWGSIKYFFEDPNAHDEFTINDRRKVPVYLEVSFNNLQDMFSITEEIFDTEPEPILASNCSGFEMTNDFKFLTPEKVRSRIKTLKYDGDPDLLPIRTDECAFLVRSLYQFASKINENFGQTFYQLYHSPTFGGRLSRQILCPPMTVYKYDKSIVGSSRVNVHLPPRVSFRPCASYKFLGYLLFGALIAWIFNYRIDCYLLFLIFIFVFYKTLRALPRDSSPSIRHSYPTQGFGNISFNDSF